MNEIYEKAQNSLRQKKYSEALELFRQVDGDKENSVSAVIGMAKCLYGLNRFSEACIKCQEALTIEPNNPSAHALLADVYEGLGDLQKSREEGRLAYTIDPNSPWALTVYGTQLVEDKRIDEGIQILEKAAMIDDTFYLAHKELFFCIQSNLLYAYSLKKNNKKVIEHVKKVYTLQPTMKWKFAVLIAYMNKFRIFTIIGALFLIALIGFIVYPSWVFLIIFISCILFLFILGILQWRFFPNRSKETNSTKRKNS